MRLFIVSKICLLGAVLLGIFLGVASFTVKYAEGPAYLSDDSKVCKNCHIMNDQFDSWSKGPHHATATCNDCHVPPQFLAKYLAKGRNGYHHSFGFTFQPTAPDEPNASTVFEEPIRIKPINSQILQDNCLRCHADIVSEMVLGSTSAQGAVRCVLCHRAVGHGAQK